MPTTNDLKWDALYGKLMKYKEEHGNTLVPNRHPQLGSWVSTQRRYYKEMNSGKETSLTQARIDKLEQIEFVWATKDPRHVPWEVRYEQLLDYKARNGDCIVPIGYKHNVQLANWVSTQRQEYKLWKKHRQCRITTERVNLLMGVGFSFVPPRGGARIQKRKGASEDSDSSVSSISTRNSKSSEKSNKKAKTPFLPVVSNEITPQKRKPWIKSFQDYIWCKDNETCVSNNEMINQWCENQRVHYRLWQNNPKTSELTEERLNLLNSINFEWDTHSAIAKTMANSGNQDIMNNRVASQDISPTSAEDIELAETLLSLGSISSPEGSPEESRRKTNESWPLLKKR